MGCVGDAIAGMVFWAGFLSTWVVSSLISSWLFEPAHFKYALVGGRYAVLWLVPLAFVLGALVAASIGAALGVIDRALLAVAHLRFISPRDR